MALYKSKNDTKLRGLEQCGPGYLHRVIMIRPSKGHIEYVCTRCKSRRVYHTNKKGHPQPVDKYMQFTARDYLQSSHTLFKKEYGAAFTKGTIESAANVQAKKDRTLRER